MSYCRFAWEGSDVYVYEGVDGIVCCGCHLAKKHESWFVTNNPEEMIAHLALHRRVGEYVLPRAIIALWEGIPGKSRPRTPPPAALEKISIAMTIAHLQARLEKLDESEKPSA